MSDPPGPPQYAHTNAVIKAGKLRALDEQSMANHLQRIQRECDIYNPDIEPEHPDGTVYCRCPIHKYKARKAARLPVQIKWSEAVMYPGERYYHDIETENTIIHRSPYRYVSSYYCAGGMGGTTTTIMYGDAPRRKQRSDSYNYSRSLEKTTKLNAQLNLCAQVAIDRKEPISNIWHVDGPEPSALNEDHVTISSENGKSMKLSRLSGLRKALFIKSPEEKEAERKQKAFAKGEDLRIEILNEENGRWPTKEWRDIVTKYQEHVGMTQKIADLRARCPIQYLHLLRAGYFEPIPVEWANLASNPLKFRIEAAAGWPGITPTWRGFEDTAEERLYWVLNYREGSSGPRMKPDPISAMKMARSRMASAVMPPPGYYSPDDVCHVQHMSDHYSRQVMPTPFKPSDVPELPSSDTMILLDVSGSMNFEPIRPIYEEALIRGYEHSTQPKNKDLAKAIIRRFTDAMIHHDHNATGYRLATFHEQAKYIGILNHENFDKMWNDVSFGGMTRVMTGWQLVKDLHFQKYSETASYHPVYGWQAGPKTPKLRLLLLLDGEASDMDEFELDLLSLSWVHVTIFLIGVDGCPHHHRHANELQRISEVNPHVSFIDAQGNTPERFVTHELLKRHLGYDITMSEFEELERPPSYDELEGGVSTGAGPSSDVTPANVSTGDVKA
ncbi:uncharacterized protein N7503_008855 [Penicillium pulvis]|uniref:uncharacterized protein n=1 Tax=Penicillium pulvis TaxID=1562058 RepID=UPI00254836DC|nr:uncharacterized protein N7503_008855 [Penicillium pulvis]KAJ5792877.1 hypothetical protein N7503_008855 [Penicillium pulvis]